MSFEDNSLLRELVGAQNHNLDYIEKALEVSIHSRGNELTITGQEKNIIAAEDVLKALWHKLQKNQDITLAEVEAAVRFSKNTLASEERSKDTQDGYASGEGDLSSFLDDDNTIKTRKKHVSARSPLQAKYIEEMRNKDMVFALGPGGTGKTFLAVAMAAMMYMDGKVERMIFTRPAVEAGENLGFLPGDMKEKMDPYLRPIYDSLFDIMYGDKVARNIENGDIEIAPLAFMRGRTLKNAFVVLDEAQNTTPTQMKMFLTRMGQGSKMVITGDPSQVDLPPKSQSGLVEAMDVLKEEPDIGFINFTSKDVVRHKLVTKIVEAYDRHKK